MHEAVEMGGSVNAVARLLLSAVVVGFAHAICVDLWGVTKRKVATLRERRTRR